MLVAIDRIADLAGAYLRISKDALKLGLGVDRQDELCRQVADRRGWTIAEVYVDNDISASNGRRRPEYERLCADIAAGRRDGIVAVDLDRLTRHPRELEDIIDLTDAAGVPIALSSGEYDLTSSDDRLRARMLGAVAKQETEKKSERIRRQKDWARRTGRWVGRAPFGYRTVDHPEGGRVLELVDEEAAIARQLARMVLDGTTLHAAAQWASDQPDAVTRAGKSGWSPQAVRRILTKPVMAGWQVEHRDLYRHPDTDQPVRVADPAVFDEVTWQRLRRLFSGRKRAGTTGRSTDALLARIVVCDECGHAMSYSRGGKRGAPRYYCRTSYERSGDCPGNGATASYVEELVDQWVTERLDDLVRDGVSTLVSSTSDDGAAAEIDHLTAVLRSQEDERRRLLLDGASAERVAAVQETLDIVDGKLRAARQRLEASRRRVDVTDILQELGPTDHAAHYLDSPVPVRRRIIGRLATEVRVASAGGVARRGWFDVSRIKVKRAW